jgi:hypothetical protein
MTLISAIDDLVALVDAYYTVPFRRRPPFDVSRFESLDLAVYVEAVALKLADHLPRPRYVNNPATFGYTNLPGCRTQRDTPGLFEPMPSQIPCWRSQMLTLRALAATSRSVSGDGVPVGAYEKIPKAPTLNDEEFLGFPEKQQKLLRALQHKEPVSMTDVKKAVYETTYAANSRLERLKTRTNKRLIDQDYALEIKRKSNAYRLVSL